MIIPIPGPLPDNLEQARQQLIEMLAHIDRQWHAARAPILARLVEIECLRPPPRFVMNVGDLSPGVLEALKKAD